jgi:hypothetical protein
MDLWDCRERNSDDQPHVSVTSLTDVIRITYKNIHSRIDPELERKKNEYG